MQISIIYSYFHKLYVAFAGRLSVKQSLFADIEFLHRLWNGMLDCAKTFGPLTLNVLAVIFTR